MRKRKLGGAVYVLPNLFTTGNLFFGFFSIIKALQGQFGWAASAIFIAAIFDVLDGRVARLTKGTSEFGVQYDSLCDLVSFGCAPAFMMFQFSLHQYNRLGWIICFIFMACGALRLARFNVQSSIGKASGDFIGLPIPMAAIVIASFVLYMVHLDANEDLESLSVMAREIFLEPTYRGYFLLAAAPMLSFSMVSNVVYRSHKSIKITGFSPFKMLAVGVLLVSLVAYKPELSLFMICLLYFLSGPFEYLIGRKKLIEDDEIFSLSDDQSIEDGDDEEASETNVSHIKKSEKK